MNIHLSYELYSTIVKKCMEQELFSLSDLYDAAIVSSWLYPAQSKRNFRKIYKSICEILKDVAEKDYDEFLNHYYNQVHYGKTAKENVTAFLDGVATVYKHLFFRSDEKSQVRFLYGKKFSVCCKTDKKHFTEIVIDTDDIECYLGNVDYFYIHFNSGFTISFYYGNLSVYSEI